MSAAVKSSLVITLIRLPVRVWLLGGMRTAMYAVSVTLCVDLSMILLSSSVRKVTTVGELMASRVLGGASRQHVNVVVKRVVAMFRVVITMCPPCAWLIYELKGIFTMVTSSTNELFRNVAMRTECALRHS